MTIERRYFPLAFDVVVWRRSFRNRRKFFSIACPAGRFAKNAIANC